MRVKALVGTPAGVIVALVAVLALAGCSDDGTPETTPTPVPGLPTQIPDVCLPSPDPGRPETVSIELPLAFTRISGVTSVVGAINTSSGTFKVRIFDEAGNVIVGTTGTTTEKGVLWPFSQTLELLIVEEMPACLWVYEESERDGSPRNVAQVPIIVAPEP